MREALKVGFTIGSGAVGVICSVLAVFNLTVDILNLPLGSITGPLLSLYDRHIERAWQRIDDWLPWLLPQWPRDLFLALFLTHLTTIRAEIFGWSKHPPDGETIRVPPEFLWLSPIGLFVPWLNLLWGMGIVLTLMYSVWVSLAPASARSISVFPEVALTAGLYVCGVLGGTIVALVLNLYGG